MAEKELVITHLQIIHTWSEFARERDLQFFTKKHLEDIAQWSEDAINLLKEKEAVKPEWSCGKAYCGACGKRLPLKRWKHKPFCPSCGKAVNWDD